MEPLGLLIHHSPFSFLALFSEDSHFCFPWCDLGTHSSKDPPPPCNRHIDRPIESFLPSLGPSSQQVQWWVPNESLFFTLGSCLFFQPPPPAFTNNQGLFCLACFPGMVNFQYYVHQPGGTHFQYPIYMLQFPSNTQDTFPNKSHVYHSHIFWCLWVSISVLPISLIDPL